MKIDKVLNIDVSEPVNIPIGAGKHHEMTLYEAARWYALLRGIDTIEKKARQLKINLDKSKMWIKPLALQKYVDEETAACITEIKTLKDNKEDALHNWY